MYLAYVVLSALFAVMLTMSARMKLVRDPRAVEVIGDIVGVPLRFFAVLAMLEVAGAVGLLIGIGLRPLGVVTGIALVVYFVVATSAHLRRRDIVPGHLLPPVMMLAISAGALALRIAT